MMARLRAVMMIRTGPTGSTTSNAEGAAERTLALTPGVVRLHERVALQPRVAAYLESDRRLPFNEQGIFRRYPELDLP
jgi:hypothetical protein